MLHEYGHLLGLGDTYNIVGRNEPVAQELSTMKNEWDAGELKADDIVGIRALWASLKLGYEKCHINYQVGAATANEWNYLFCVRNTGALN